MRSSYLVWLEIRKKKEETVKKKNQDQHKTHIKTKEEKGFFSNYLNYITCIWNYKDLHYKENIKHMKIKTKEETKKKKKKIKTPCS